jgi:hypothetical protein
MCPADGHHRDRADRTVNVRAPALLVLVVARMRPSTIASRWKEFPTSSGAVSSLSTGVQRSARASWLRSSSQPTSVAPSTRSRQKSKTASRCSATACHPAAAQDLWLLSSHTYGQTPRGQPALGPSARCRLWHWMDGIPAGWLDALTSASTSAFEDGTASPAARPWPAASRTTISSAVARCTVLSSQLIAAQRTEAP